MKTFAVMLTFLTRIPLPIRFDVQYKDYVNGVGWTPVIALMIGGPLFFADMLDAYVHPFILSVLILAVYLLLSGALHVDGMADTMDAFGSNRDKKRMLEILSDTKMGTFGVLSIVVYCIGMVVLLPVVPRYSLLLFPLVGRTAALLCAKTHGYARESGLGKSFVEGAKFWQVVVSAAAYLILAYVVVWDIRLQSVLAAVLPLLSVLAVWMIVHGMSKKIGGITGDLIGYSIEVSQILYLLLTYIAVAIGQTAV